MSDFIKIRLIILSWIMKEEPGRHDGFPHYVFISFILCKEGITGQNLLKHLYSLSAGDHIQHPPSRTIGGYQHAVERIPTSGGGGGQPKSRRFHLTRFKIHHIKI
jgi:hypothetical protein